MRGHACDKLQIARSLRQERLWERYEAELATWIERLTRPAGVMIASDQLGTALLEACSPGRAMCLTTSA
jgi:hypothetical protein